MKPSRLALCASRLTEADLARERAIAILTRLIATAKTPSAARMAANEQAREIHNRTPAAVAWLEAQRGLTAPHNFTSDRTQQSDEQRIGVDTFKIDIWYGTVELQQRPVFDDAGGLGYESRSVWRDRSGVVQKLSEWSPPLCWLRVGEPQKPPRPWWARRFGAA